MKLVGMLLMLTLLASSCAASTQTQGQQILPTRPILTSLAPTPEGGIMLDNTDTARLLHYIDDLEYALGAGSIR